MHFEEKKTRFGGHETFALRYSWLTKGYQEFLKNPSVFSDENATVILGVGVNMVHSIKFWLQACQIIKADPKDFTLSTTEIGRLIFDEKDGYDPYLEDEATIWLIHWLIASNSQIATAFFWFFNNFHKQEFSQDEATTSLTDFVTQNISRKISKNTLKNDISAILRMYGRSTSNKKGVVVEEALDSPLVLLQLISPSMIGRSFKSFPADRKNLPTEIFAYALVCYMKSYKRKEVPIKELMYSDGNSISLAAVFRMTENSLIAKLENMVSLDSNLFELRETAGINQFYMTDEVNENDLLAKYYRKYTISKVA